MMSKKSSIINIICTTCNGSRFEYGHPHPEFCHTCSGHGSIPRLNDLGPETMVNMDAEEWDKYRRYNEK